MPILSSKGKSRFFSLFLGWKIGSFCVQFDLVFFAKQSEGFLVFFSAAFLRLAAAVFSVCRYKGVTAEHPPRRIGKKRVQGISERLRICLWR